MRQREIAQKVGIVRRMDAFVGVQRGLDGTYGNFRAITYEFVMFTLTRFAYSEWSAFFCCHGCWCYRQVIEKCKCNTVNEMSITKGYTTSIPQQLFSQRFIHILWVVIIISEFEWPSEQKSNPIINFISFHFHSSRCAHFHRCLAGPRSVPIFPHFRFSH